MLSVALYIKDNPLIRETFCVVVFNKDIVSACSLTHPDEAMIAKDWGQYFVYKAIKIGYSEKSWIATKTRNVNIFLEKNANWKCGICTVRSISNVACCKGLTFAFINVHYDLFIKRSSIYVINIHFPDQNQNGALSEKLFISTINQIKYYLFNILCSCVNQSL